MAVVQPGDEFPGAVVVWSLEFGVWGLGFGEGGIRDINIMFIF
jgi:hypothetical protein